MILFDFFLKLVYLALSTFLYYEASAIPLWLIFPENHSHEKDSIQLCTRTALNLLVILMFHTNISVHTNYLIVATLMTIQTIIMLVLNNDLLVESYFPSWSEPQLYCCNMASVMLYAVICSVVLFMPPKLSENGVKKQLEDLYKKYEPEKLQQVGAILKRNEGQEEMMINLLKAKYEKRNMKEAGASATRKVQKNGEEPVNLLSAKKRC